MKIWARFSSDVNNKPKNRAPFRLIRSYSLIDKKVSFTYDIQKKKKFLFFEWWETVDTGYKDIHKARNVALVLFCKENKSHKLEY